MMRDGSLNGTSGDYKKMVNGDLNNIEVVDELTAVIHTNTSLSRAGFERQLTFGVLPQAYFERIGGEDEFRKAPIGTGPFQFVEHRANEYFRAEALDTHWRRTAAYRTVTIYKIPDPNTALAQLQTGKVDIAGLAPIQLAEIKNNKEIRVERLVNSGEIFVIFGGMVQPTRPAYDPTSPWTSADLLTPNPTKVREALTIAVDQKAIVDKLLLGEAHPVNVPYHFDVPGAPWYNPAWKPREYNPTRAKQLLAEAGYPNGFSLKAYIYALPYNPSNGDVMEAVSGYWEAIGVKVERVVAEYRPTVRTRLTERTTAGYVYTYTNPGYPEPYTYLSSSCCFRTDAVLNHWEITKVDQLTDQTRLAYDENKRNALMKQVGDFIYENYIGIPIAATNSLWAVRADKVGKWGPTPGSSTLRNLEFVEKP
jgi:peptide/nickel transport system substrate-binding protein